MSHRIAVIAGDGIGRETVPAGIEVLEATARRFGIDLAWTELDWSCERFLKTGEMMPGDGMRQLAEHDAIFLGAVGFPGVPDHVSLWKLLIPIRRQFQLYANIRPVRLFEGVDGPLKHRLPGDIDMVIVRENCEGEYSEMGGRIYAGTPDEFALQEAVFTRKGVDRILTYAFDLAMTRARKKVTSATKSNGIIHTMPFWDERFAEVKTRYPEVAADQFHIDILCAHFVRNPQWFDVVVASNLFGDILSDLGPACTGSIGIAPSGNINPEGDYPSLFEPVHGSAPDIAGKGIANPIGQIWSGAMMLDHLGHHEAAASIERAIAAVLAGGGPKTPDLGGQASTRDLTAAIVAAVATA